MTSIIQTFKSKVASAILDDYRIIRDEADAILEIEGKTIRRALMEQTSWQSYYDQKRGELKSLLKYFNEVVMGPIRGSKWKDLTEESNISLSQKDKEYYLRTYTEIVDLETVYIILEELYYEFDAICEAFRSRGYALKHISELMIAQIEDSII